MNSCTSQMMKRKITLYVEWLKRLDTLLNELTNQNSNKSPKLLSQRIRKRYNKTLRTSVINIPMSPPSLAVDILTEDYFDNIFHGIIVFDKKVYF